MEVSTEELFKQNVLNKWNPNLDVGESFINCILGIVSEFAEVAELGNKDFNNDDSKFRNELTSELGDLLFYITKLQLLTGEQLVKVPVEDCLTAFSEVAQLIGGVKKLQFHNKPFDYNNFSDALNSIYTKLIVILEFLEIDIEAVMLYNINKLNKRHGEGISFKEYGQRLDAGQEA